MNKQRYFGKKLYHIITLFRYIHLCGKMCVLQVHRRQGECVKFDNRHKQEKVTGNHMLV